MPGAMGTGRLLAISDVTNLRFSKDAPPGDIRGKPEQGRQGRLDMQ